MNNNIQVQKTEDGSPTLYSAEYDQTYHNSGGAVSESRHVFFEKSGLQHRLEKGDSVTILEIGLGTGLNLLLTLDLYLSYGYQQPITYHTIEANPISVETVNALDYQSFLSHTNQGEVLPEIFRNLNSGINRRTLDDSFELGIFAGYFKDYPNRMIEADFIFHDAFSPDVNPELWEGHTFKKVASNASSDAILTTYGAASGARGAMCWAGWTVARAEGALGKREMTIAARRPEILQEWGLKLVNNERLARRYEMEDFD